MILLIISIAAILFFSFQAHEWEVRSRQLAEQLDDAQRTIARLQGRLNDINEENDIA